eukprot:gene8619-566_t
MKESISHSELNLVEIMENEILLNQFQQFCCEELCSESLFYMKQVKNYQNITDKEKLLEEDSTYEINITQTLLRPITHVLLKEPEKISQELFHKINHSVEWMLSDHVNRFNKKLEQEKAQMISSRKFSFMQLFKEDGFWRKKGKDSSTNSSNGSTSPQNSPLPRSNSYRRNSFVNIFQKKYSSAHFKDEL